MWGRSIAVGHLEDNIFSGTFTAKLLYKEIQMPMQLDGIFRAHIG
jgi:hypothetical protein